MKMGFSKFPDSSHKFLNVISAGIPYIVIAATINGSINLRNVNV